jgi:hypothetical protein
MSEWCRRHPGIFPVCQGKYPGSSGNKMLDSGQLLRNFRKDVGRNVLFCFHATKPF